jgi:fucose permease
MLRERYASLYASGISATGFWAGQCLGRTLLGFITERYGERLCVTIYLALSLCLELTFWLVPQFVVSAVAIAFLGFFLGPIFPAGVVMCTKLLPKHLHVTALGTATAVAGIGGAVVPFAVGAIAQAKGVWVLQPIILALVAVISGLWLLLPRTEKARNA